MKLTYDSAEVTIERAVELELTPDAYGIRKRKERVANMLAGLMQVLVDKNILTAKDFSNIFHEVNVVDD